MNKKVSLEQYLGSWAGTDGRRMAAASTVAALVAACRDIARIVGVGPLAGDLAARRSDIAGGDFQTELDVRANDLLAKALESAPVAAMASEEMDAPLALAPGAPIIVALDPLDGSSNIDTNVSVGTIFSLLNTPHGSDGGDPAAFLRAGREQVAAGYVIYGPQTALALTLGAGTDIFTLDAASRTFWQTAAKVRVAPHAREFAINASNYRHWDPPVRTWFDDCLAGEDGPRAVNFNMRWIASMVAEAHRILVRGGVYLYPGDARQGYRNGRLRLLYEANPIAFLMEQAGAAASTGREAVLDYMPGSLHERVPFVFGAREEVERLERYHLAPLPKGEGSPLFARRGLFV
ncbi:MAG: class 1 fructose-bisphosphatase [Proteobacteria bacterium]|nr:class 1 fructose-bisphosphatase [Pseudomonadota bacterium]